MGVYVGDNLVAGNVGEVYSKAQVDAMIANAVALAEPTGSIKPFAGTTVPDGYLLCDGSAVSRTTYAALFAVIGTTYGTGDGSTTFNLPNLTGGKSVRGVALNSSAFGNTTDGSLPKIIGQASFAGDSSIMRANSNVSGSFYKGQSRSYSPSGATAAGNDLAFDAYLCSTAYSRDDNKVIPYGTHVYLCIKY